MINPFFKNIGPFFISDILKGPLFLKKGLITYPFTKAN